MSIRRFLGDEKGATAIEYGVLLAFVLLVLVAAIEMTGLGSSRLFVDSNNKMQSAGLGK